MALANHSDLVGVGHVRLAGQQLVADAQRVVLVVVVVRRLGLPVLLRPRRLGRVELDVERILVDVLRRAVEQRDAVVAGVGADVAADLADVAGQRRQQEDVAVLVVVVEELVRPHADGEQRRARVRRRCARASDSTAAAGAQVSSSAVFGVEVRRRTRAPGRRPAGSGPSCRRRASPRRALEQRDRRRREVLADLVAGERPRRASPLRSHHDVVAPLARAAASGMSMSRVLAGGGGLLVLARSTCVWLSSARRLRRRRRRWRAGTSACPCAPGAAGRSTACT